MSLMSRASLSKIFILVVSTALFSGCTLFAAPKGGLRVTSSTPADVYLDGKSIGTTDLSKMPLDVKNYKLKIVPKDPNLATEETPIKMFAGFETTVDWQFGKTVEDNSGFIFEAENSHKRDASEIEIITNPDNVPITMNNEDKGFSPQVIDDLPLGEYQIALQAPGYAKIVRTVKLIKGKRLIVTVKLARKPVEVAVASPSAQLAPLPTPASTPKATPKTTPKPTVKPVIAIAKPYVEILETPTGFLRVRSTPAASGTELGQLMAGQAVPYGGETTNNWFKIVYKATSSAWISGQYSKLVK